MTTEAQAYIERLDYLRSEAKKAILGLTAEGLDWMPLQKDTSSASVIIAHMAGVESHRVQQVVGGVDIHRNRDAEFLTRGTTVAELEALLDRTGQATHRVLANLSSDDLSKTKPMRPGDAPIALRSAVVNGIEHMAQHLGHLTLTRQLYEASKG